MFNQTSYQELIKPEEAKKDEVNEFGFIKSAEKIVNRVLSNDESLSAFRGPSTNPEIETDEDLFQIKKKTVLPKAIFEEYHQMQYKCFMGLFESIARAWVSIDNKFFIWSYVDGGDFTVFDELDQVIVSAGLVKTKKGVFKDYIKHLLILATPVQVVFVAVTMTESGELNLLPTNYSVATDNVNMLCIKGTEEGRIFMTGADGFLYELQYEAQDGFFRKKCRKLNHSQGFFGLFIPSFFKFSQDAPIVDIAIDNSRHILYTLNTSNQIDVHYLGNRGTDMMKILSYTTILKDAMRIFNYAPCGKNFKLVSIAAITEEEIENSHLVGISNLGARFYFTIDTRFSKPNNFRLNYLRIFQQPPNMYVGADKHFIDIHESFYKNGVFLMADSSKDENDQLLCLTVETQKNSPFGSFIQKSSRSPITETLSLLKMKGKTLSITEIPVKPIVSFRSPNQTYNEISSQIYEPPREFFCLSNTGIKLLTKLRPVDKLRSFFQALPQHGKHDYHLINNFFKKYGRDEGCFMCLVLACTHTAKSRFPLNSSVRKDVESVLFEFGGDPEPRQHVTRGNISSNMGGLSNRDGDDDVIFSSTHNALYLYFSRIIRPIWSSPFIGKYQGTAKLMFNPSHVRHVTDLLAGLMEFLKKYDYLHDVTVNKQPIQRRIYGEPREDRMVGGLLQMKPVDYARKKQKESIRGLYMLVERCIQIVTIIKILEKCDLNRFLKEFPVNTLSTLEKVRFSNVATSHDEKLLKDLIRLIVEKIDKSELSIEDVYATLQNNCSAYFTANDIREYRAFDLLQQAKRSDDAKYRETFLQKSLEEYLNIAGDINVGMVCGEFQKCRFYSGCITLALAAAQLSDSLQRGIEYAKTQNAHDNEGYQCYMKRIAAYKAALAVLEELYHPDPVQASNPRNPFSSQQKRPRMSDEKRSELCRKILIQMTESKDQLFHSQLYQWFFDRKRESELFDLDTPYLEEYILKLKDFNLLWRYYQATEKFDKAAEILRTLAQQQNPQVSLEERKYYLTKAIGNAKAGCGLGERLGELQNRLEIAQVQERLISDLKEKVMPSLVEESKRQKAIVSLSSQLVDLSTMYNDYALPFKLYDSALSILHCSNYLNPATIQNLWIHILVNVITKQPDSYKQALEQKLKRLKVQLYPSSFFPVDFIVALLEKLTIDTADHDYVYKVLQKCGISHSVLYFAYRKLYEYLWDIHDGSQFFVSAHLAPKNYLLQRKDSIKVKTLSRLTTILVDWFEQIERDPDTEFPAHIIESHIIEYDSVCNEFSDSMVQSIQEQLTHLKRHTQ